MILNDVNTIKIGDADASVVYQGSTKVWEKDKPTIYGWHVDPSISDPSQAVTYLADAVGKTPAKMGSSTFNYGDWQDAFFMPRPCMLRSDGTVAYYLDPEDYSRKLIDNEYRQVEYIQNTGTQFIETDIVPTYNQRWEIDCVLGDYVEAASRCGYIFGIWSGGTDTVPAQNISIIAEPPQSSSAKARVAFYAGYDWTTSLWDYWLDTDAGTRALGILQKGRCSWGSASLTPSGYSGFTTPPTLPLSIFGIRIPNRTNPLNLRHMKLYGMKIYESDTLIHNLTPVERISDGELGLYDAVTRKFYSNTGTGTFVKGSYVANSDASNSSFDGNAMMEWPLIWYKFEAGSQDGEGYFYCSDKQVDSSYTCWCNLDANGDIIPHFYTAIYNGTGTSKLRSISGSAIMGGSAEALVSKAAANNTTPSHEWDISLISDRLLINALLVLLGKTLAMQTTYGYGNVSSTSSSIRTGAMNGKGLFWGSVSSQTSGVKVFGMENWWGAQYDFTLGIVFSGDRMLAKLTYGKSDGSNTVGYNLTGSGYNDVGPVPDNSDRINAMNFTPLGTYPLKIRQWDDADDSLALTHYGAYLLRATEQCALEAGNWWGAPGPVYKHQDSFPYNRAADVKMRWREQGSFELLSHKNGVQMCCYAIDPTSKMALSGSTGWHDSPWTFNMSDFGVTAEDFLFLAAVRKSDNSDFASLEETGGYITLKDNSPRILAFGGAYITGKYASAYTAITLPSTITVDHNSTRLSCKPVGR